MYVHYFCIDIFNSKTQHESVLLKGVDAVNYLDVPNMGLSYSGNKYNPNYDKLNGRSLYDRSGKYYLIRFTSGNGQTFLGKIEF